MPNTRWTGGVVPTVDDNLIEAWDAYDDSAGRVMPAASVAAARVMLAAAPSGAVSKARPAGFIIDDILYTADGSKAGDGSTLTPPTVSVACFTGIVTIRTAVGARRRITPLTRGATVLSRFRLKVSWSSRLTCA